MGGQSHAPTMRPRRPSASRATCATLRRLRRARAARRWGPYLPFTHPFTGETFHARHSFAPSESLGFAFDELPARPRRFLREPPYVARFERINIIELLPGGPVTLYVYVVDATKGFEGGTPLPSGGGPAAEPAAAGEEGEEGDALVDHPNFANLQAIFFLDTPAG